MSIALYPDIILQNDLSPDHFGSTVDDLCQEIVDATSGWGANKQKVIDAIATQDATIRTQMSIRFAELHKGEKLPTLREVMKKEFSGNFGTALQLLALPLHEAECYMLKKATQGIGASTNIVWSILTSRTNAEIEIIKKTYFKLFSKDLGKLLASELHGNMERLIFTCLQGAEEEFDAQYHTKDKALEDAEIIHKKGQGRWGTEERGIFKILGASPPQHLEQISAAYSDKYGYTLMKAMEKELGGEVQKAVLHMLGMKLKPFETVATLIRNACAGIGTDEMLLTCSIIRYQMVLPNVVGAHIDLYGKSLHQRIRSETGGKYREVLLQIVNVTWPEQG
jgi:hypothetical protein